MVCIKLDLTLFNSHTTLRAWLCRNSMHLTLCSWAPGIYHTHWRESSQQTHEPIFSVTGSNSHLPDSHCDKTRLEMEWIQVMIWKRKVLLLLLTLSAPSRGRTSAHALPPPGGPPRSHLTSDPRQSPLCQSVLTSAFLHSSHHNLTFFYLLIFSLS